MKEFIGRERELRALEEAYRSRKSALIPIYGRRRVGKSELILRFLQDKAGIYYLGKRSPAGLQIREFLQEASVALGEPLLATFPGENWKRALEAVVERWKGPRKLLIALDEFQWIAGASPELPSVLQELWDRKWEAPGSVCLILCGSYVGFMEREVLGEKSPLFGRRTAQIFLKPFEYLDAAKFHPNYSVESKARTYFICGGIPLYLKFFSDSCSVEMNIEKNLLNEYAPLFREPDFLLREELREIENYYAILFAIASGSLTSREIAGRTGIGNRAVYYYLEHLVELGYLSRRYPLTEKRPKARDVRYHLKDPLLRFWFRFVYPNASYVLQGGPRLAFRERILPDLDAYFGSCFERLCREALPKIYMTEGVGAPYQTGQYWDKKIQIDVVGLRGDAWTDLGECKWGKVESVRAIEEALLRKVEAYPNERNATIGKRIFTRSPVRAREKSRPDFRWHTLPELYEK
jgi:AAA+ ATPase superfamily predicted ATPase